MLVLIVLFRVKLLCHSLCYCVLQFLMALTTDVIDLPFLLVLSVDNSCLPVLMVLYSGKMVLQFLSSNQKVGGV